MDSPMTHHVVRMKEFMKYATSGMLIALAVVNFIICMKSLDSQSPLQTQYYALAIGFSVVIAINETPIAGTILIILSFVPNIQATPPLLWLAYRIMIHDERVYYYYYYY